MILLYCDETSVEPIQGLFFIYGGLAVPSAKALSRLQPSLGSCSAGATWATFKLRGRPPLRDQPPRLASYDMAGRVTTGARRYGESSPR